MKNQYGVENSATATVAVSTSPTPSFPSDTSGFSYFQLPLNQFAKNGAQVQGTISASRES